MKFSIYYNNIKEIHYFVQSHNISIIYYAKSSDFDDLSRLKEKVNVFKLPYLKIAALFH